jgi:hypothetical protein
MKKSLKLILAVIMSILVISLNLLIANASASQTDTNDYGYYYNVVDLDYSTYLSAPYYAPTVAALSSWNSPPAPCRCSMIFDKYSLNKVYVETLPSDIGGIYRYITLNGGTHHKTTSFSISINSLIGNQTSTYLQSEACHEMGHALGLADDGSSQWSIMNWNRNREQAYTRYVADCYGLQYIWSM